MDPVLSLRSSALVANSSRSNTSRMYASPASTLAIMSKIANVMTIIRRRILSVSAPITGNKRVMRRDSMRKRPMEISTMMMTSAAMSAVRNAPMKLVPPTISAMGRAINVKLIAAPAVATASTRAEMKKYTIDEDDNTDSARSSRRERSFRTPPCGGRWRANAR